MLRTSSRPDPAPRVLRSIRWVALALVALGLPGLASAASVTFDVLDPSGYGATVTIGDGTAPGTIDIDIDSVGPLGADPIGDILAIHLVGDLPAPDLDASGADVEEVSSFPGDPNLLVNIGVGSLFQLNGITSTSVLLSSATQMLSAAALEGLTLQIWLGFDGTLPDAPGFAFDDELNALKPSAVIPVIPEPGTATMMMLGLMGLAASARRVKD